MPDTNTDIDYQALVDQANASAGKPLESTPAAFAAYYAPVAQKISDQTGIDPNTILGQFGLETGWGKSIVPGTNNLGNIKSTNGQGVTATDNQNGSVDKYRKYDSVDDFANDYANLLNTRYQGALNTGTDAAATAKALSMGGYAQDKNYVSKLVAATSMVGKARGLTPQDAASGSSMNPISSANAAGNVPKTADGQIDYQALVNSLKDHPAAPQDNSSFLGSVGSSIADAADGIATGAGQVGLGGVALAGRGIKAAGDALGSDGLSSAGSYLNDHATTAVKNLGQQQTDFTGDSTSGKVGNFIGQGLGSVPLALATGPLGEAAGAASIVGRAAPVVAGAVDFGTQGAILGASNAAGAGQSDLLTPTVTGAGVGAILGGATGAITSKLSQYLSGAGKDFNAAVDATINPADAGVPGGLGAAAVDATANAASGDVGGLGARLGGVAADTVNDAKNKIATAGYSPDELALTAAKAQLGPDFESLLAQSKYAADPVGPAVPDNLIPAANRVPLSAAQQADTPRMALLAKNIGNYSPEAKAQQAAFAMEQQSGIHQAIDQITPAQATINKLKSDRLQAVNHLYAQNDSTLVGAEDFGADLLDRPVIKAALKNANTVMKNAGEDVPGVIHQTPEEAMAQVKAAGGNAAAQLKALEDAIETAKSSAPTHISGRQAQIMEQDLRDTASNMTTATPAERSSAKAAYKDFRAAVEEHFPLWAEAQDTYGRLSKPITDAEFAQNFASHPSTTLMNGDSKNLTQSNFNSAYKSSMAQGAAKTYGITPEMQMQMDAIQGRVNKVAQTNQKASANGSDTAPNLAGMASLESILGKNTAGGGLTPSDLLTHSGTVMGTIAGIAKKGLERAQQPVREAAARAVQDVVQNPAGLAQLVERVAAKAGKLSGEAGELLNNVASASPDTVANVVRHASQEGKATVLNGLTASNKKKVLALLTTVGKQMGVTGLLQSIQSDSSKKK